MKRLLPIITGFILLGFSESLSTSIVDKMHILVGCSIIDFQGNELAHLNGQSCFPLSDGSYISYRRQKVSKVGSTGDIVWSAEQHVHHDQVRVYCQEKRVALLTHSVHDYKGEKMLFDKIVILNTDTGAEVFKMDLYDHLKRFETEAKSHQRELKGFVKMNAKASPYYGFDEFLHGNTLYVEDEHGCLESAPKDLLYMALNFSEKPIILHLNLQEQSIRSFQMYPGRVIHDVKKVPEDSGKLLVFNNAYWNSQNQWVSTYEIFDEREKKTIKVFDNKETEFYKLVGGGVEMFSKSVIFLNQVDGKIISVFTPSQQLAWRGKVPQPSLRGLIIKDMSLFLSNHKAN